MADVVATFGNLKGIQGDITNKLPETKESPTATLPETALPELKHGNVDSTLKTAISNFDALDTDGKGYITRKDLLAHSGNLKEQLSQDRNAGGGLVKTQLAAITEMIDAMDAEGFGKGAVRPLFFTKALLDKFSDSGVQNISDWKDWAGANPENLAFIMRNAMPGGGSSGY